jgi:hypothetical protein
MARNAVSSVGYLTTETDPIFTAWDKSSGINITSSQISDFNTSVDSRISTQKGQINGLADLDSTEKSKQLNYPRLLLEVLIIKETWDASTNTPALASG